MSITVVSGLPRSGTSMLMRCLEAGGVPPIVDELRVADPDNPNGYYEFEPVKDTKNDSSWLKQADGKAVKMVYRLLRDLPTTYQFDVVVMRRHMKEVLASQLKMLERLGMDRGPSDELMASLFQRELDEFYVWANQQDHLRVMEVWYHEIIQNPVDQFARVSDHLGRALNVASMADLIDPSLYRNRVSQVVE